MRLSNVAPKNVSGLESKGKDPSSGASSFKQIANELKKAGGNIQQVKDAFSKFNKIPPQTLFSNSSKAEARKELMQICDIFEKKMSYFDDDQKSKDSGVGKTETFKHLEKAVKSATHETIGAALKDSVLKLGSVFIDGSMTADFEDASKSAKDLRGSMNGNNMNSLRGKIQQEQSHINWAS